MNASLEEYQQLRAYIGSSTELTSWIAGAKALALLSGAIDSGVINAIRTRSTAQQIADATSMDKQSVDDLCLALEVHGVVQRDGDFYELAPDYVLLSSPTAAIPLQSAIRYAMVMIRALQTGTPADVTRTGFGLHERPLACVDGWERFMFEVFSKMRSSMIVPQGNPLLATGLCLPAAHCCPPVTPTIPPFARLGSVCHA